MLNRKRGVYVTSETGIVPGSGAMHHINVGKKELKKSFELFEMDFTCGKLLAHSSRVSIEGNQNVSVNSKSNRGRSAIKQILLPVKFLWYLVKNILCFIRYFSKIKKLNPDFIYERSAYLSYAGLWIARYLKIKHIYEVNGILWMDFAKFYPKWWTRISQKLESWAYAKSDFVFFVGGIGEYFEVPNSKFESIQNGIDESYLSKFKEVHRSVNLPLKVAFVGHAMPHHRLDILVDATKKLKNGNNIEINLIGQGLEEIGMEMEKYVKVINYGKLSHDKIAEVLVNCHVGIIPFLRDYFSNVKMFMYGASKLAVIVPRIGNIGKIFESDEVIEILNEDSNSLASALDWSVDNAVSVERKAEVIFSKVSHEFTWESIYERISQKIWQIIA